MYCYCFYCNLFITLGAILTVFLAKDMLLPTHNLLQKSMVMKLLHLNQLLLLNLPQTPHQMHPNLVLLHLPLLQSQPNQCQEKKLSKLLLVFCTSHNSILALIFLKLSIFSAQSNLQKIFTT